jgi:hypothetical protein
MKNVKVRIDGYSRNEGTRTFEVLSREELEKRIDEIQESEIYEIYKRTFEKAWSYTFTGTAYTYVDARTGELKTSWLQQNHYQHPFDEFYEIVLCTVSSPVEDPYADDLLDCTGEEWDEFHDWLKEHDGYVREFFIDKYGEEEGEKEYQERVENWIDWLANEFDIDWEEVERQLDELYFATVEDEE